MGGYVDVAGVNTWFDEEGHGEPLVLLHGGLCSNETWGAQIPAFAQRFRVVAPERQGHGHTADAPGPLSYEAMAANTTGFLDEVVGGPACLVGWSDGGIVGLMIALKRPDLVRKLVVIGANYDTTGMAPGADDMLASSDPEGEDMAMFRGLYQMHSPDGPQHWPVLFAKFVEMAQREPHIPVDDSLESRRPHSSLPEMTTLSPSSTPSRCTAPSRTRSWPSSPELRTRCQWRSRSC
jgi:pimeloyl-ACP methyl ester carboxylesterase